MTPTRPQIVPSEATLLYPDQSFPPGQGVQAATLKSINAQIAAMNARAELNYHRAFSDWQVNKVQYESYGMPVPPPPVAPKPTTLKVVYADQDGTIVEPPAGADGLHYAWVWETK